MRTHIFKTYLFREKNILRTIEVLESTSLYSLAEAIVRAYGFDFDHAFGFFDKIVENHYFDSERKYELFTDMEDGDIEPTGARSVKHTKVSEVWKNVGDKMLFLFDYGDNWFFVVELVGLGKKEPKRKYPRVIEKIGKAPDQYPEIEDE